MPFIADTFHIERDRSPSPESLPLGQPFFVGQLVLCVWGVEKHGSGHPSGPRTGDICTITRIAKYRTIHFVDLLEWPQPEYSTPPNWCADRFRALP
jgi:hypothetical protein